MFLRSKSLARGFQPSKITPGKSEVSKVQIKKFGTEAEERIAGILKKSLNTSEVKVLDTSSTHDRIPKLTFRWMWCHVRYRS